jgi:acetylornithine deacetylase/succinyl-diaminopimelate desuccinylase-like protein
MRARIQTLMSTVREELAEMVALKSVADPRQFPEEGCLRTADLVRDKFRDEGFDDVRLELTPDGSNAVVGSRSCGNPSAPTVLLYAHYDVQPPLDDAAWRTPPFELHELDGRCTAAARPTARATSSCISWLSARSVGMSQST